VIFYKSKAFLILATIAVLIGSFIFYFFYGFPWNLIKHTSRFEKYLDNKYKTEFTIDEITYDFFHSTYHATAYAKNQPKISFYVGENNGTKETEDAYEYETWRYQAKKELSPIIEKIYPVQVNFSIEIADIKKSEIKNSQIPDYRTCTTLEIEISMEGYEVTAENKIKELQRAFQILQSLKEHGVYLHHFGISFKNKTMQLGHDENILINSFNDLDTWLKEYR